jgi:hypothetical protein
VKHHHINACISKVFSPAKTSTGMLCLPEIYICFYITSHIKIKHTVLCCCHFSVFSNENLEELIFSYNFPSPPLFLCIRILCPQNHVSRVKTCTSKLSVWALRETLHVISLYEICLHFNKQFEPHNLLTENLFLCVTVMAAHLISITK